MGRDVTLLIIVVIFILISIIDIKKKIIPNTLVIILGILSYFYNCINFTLEDIFLGGCVYLTAFSLIYGYGSDFLKKECLGFGDVKLSFSLGILMTYTTLLDVVFFINMTFSLALLYYILVMILKKHKIEEIPLGPFLIISTIVKLLNRGLL